MAGLLGKKIGMTQIFGENGDLISVTAIEAGPCSVMSVNQKNIQLGFDESPQKSLKKPQAGLFKKLNITPRRFIREVEKEAAKEYKVGDELRADLFKTGDFVDVTGVSIGKGFQGGMKRWNWHGGPMTHGSMSHRRIGSIGSTTTPGRVWKGHHLPGHMGMRRVTTQSLKVVRVDADNNLILVNGSVPGHRNSYLVIRSAKKRKPVREKALNPQAKTKKKA